MKRVVSILLLVVLFISFVPFVSAEDNFNVSHSIINSSDEIKTINVVLPVFEGFNGADEINEKLLNIALDAIGGANAAAESMLPYKKDLVEKGEPATSMVVTLDMTYDYVKIGEILSVQLDIYSYYGGAHGTSQIMSITSNTKTGEIYEFKDLFKDSTDYKSVIIKYVLDEIEKNAEWYFPDYKETILNKDGNYEFYIDGDKLVIYFGLYDIAPYAAGIRHFAIDSEDIQVILKDEVYKSIKDGRERGSINLNGKDINSDKEMLKDDYTYLIPLRAVSEALGYKVDWNKKDGAIVGGKIVSTTPQKVIDGTTYVPLSYFRDTLGENVSFGVIGNDKAIVRAYGKDSAEINNLGLVKEYVSSDTTEKAIKVYAEAVKIRNGMVQYGLMDDSLRKEKYQEFKEMGFVTGTSSPWVDSYEIIQLEENLYNIKFTYKTSVPTDTFISEINIRTIEDGQYYKITSIE